MHLSRRALLLTALPPGVLGPFGDLTLPNATDEQKTSQAIAVGTGVHVLPADLGAMVLVHEVMHGVAAHYEQEYGGAYRAALSSEGDDSPAHATLSAFLDAFPTPAILSGDSKPETVLATENGAVRTATETLLLFVTNENPAYAPAKALITDEELRKSTPYMQFIDLAGRRFAEGPKTGPDGESLLDLLLAPARHSPHSLLGQIDYIRTRWWKLLERTGLLAKLLFARDLLMEQSWLFRSPSPGPGPDTSRRSFFHGQEEEYERFTQDRDWMPNVVMIAKSTFVWLVQLERAYGRPVRTLADVPDEELATFARRGINALWLIGLWKRSKASARIKRMMGNGEALASAYSLDEYEIADELGGHGAFMHLKNRAARWGIRLASDMVPNHVGIDAQWVMRHPDWFLQSREPPYVNYTYTGHDLSSDDRVTVQIEDGYWRRTDAAVTFKRIDQHTGDVRYIYHGNDGTSMPWNDTAQLDYTRADVREAVIQTILHVARMFPIIRFDAAMTLAKRHYQRLWFPEPGSGGDIPSRAQYALTKEQFNDVMPEEFWREVVDRAAVEAPDTLLLAEAFWMMEGYFVRTLGMHRVYNSAFMNMLKTEDNAGFRLMIKNVLEFDPEVLKRFVNFMNNPDEKTAVEQFGEGDKYFGTCLLMVTLPGLPMIGHGQIEGFGEKYGMEYARPMHDETPNRWLIDRHEREIFPLCGMRQTFSGSRDFRLMDFVAEGGWVNEDVIAYTNRGGGRVALVAYHNKYAETQGSLFESAVFKRDGVLARETLAEALLLAAAHREDWVIFADKQRGIELLRSVADVQDGGLRLHLSAFTHICFSDIRVEPSTKRQPLDRVREEIGDRAVRDVRALAEEIFLRTAHVPFVELVEEAQKAAVPAEDEIDVSELAEAISDVLERELEGEAEERARMRSRVALLAAHPTDDLKDLLAAFIITDAAVHLAAKEAPTLRLDRPLEQLLKPVLGLDPRAAAELVIALTVLTPTDDLASTIHAGCKHQAVQAFLLVHDASGVRWFNKERFEAFATAAAHAARLDALDVKVEEDLATVLAASMKSGYRWEDLLPLLSALGVRGRQTPPPSASLFEDDDEDRNRR
jgi:glycosidase